MPASRNREVPAAAHRFEIAETEIGAYARSITGNFHVPPEAVREAIKSVLSVQVFGRKPA